MIRALSIDLETYGALAGKKQTVFSPPRMLPVDGVPSSLQILSCSLTLVEFPSCAPSSSTVEPIPSILADEPGPSPSSSRPSPSPTAGAATSGWSTSSPPRLEGTHLRDCRPGKTFVLPLSPETLSLRASIQADSIPPGASAAFRSSLRLTVPAAERLLLRWLAWANVLMGKNILFDLLCLRARSSTFRAILDPQRILVIEHGVLSYLENPLRPERSLKNIGKVIGTHSYDGLVTAKDGFTRSFPLFFYNGHDTHNVVLDVRELSRRILESPTWQPSSAASSPELSSAPSSSSPSSTSSSELEPPSSRSTTMAPRKRSSVSPPTTTTATPSRLSPFCLSFYSDVVWACIEMAENGVPFHRPRLEAFACALAQRIGELEGVLSPEVRLSGEGSVKSKDAFMQRLIAEVQLSFPLILDHPLLQFTEKQRKISFSDANRSLLCANLPDPHPLRASCALIDEWSHASKLLGTYCYPLLWHSKADPSNRKSILVSQDPLCPPPPLPPALCATPPSTSLGSEPTSPSTPPDPAPPSTPTCAITAPTTCTPSSVSPSRTPLEGTTNPAVWLSHPSWFVTPDAVKDGAGASGGTLQSRITCKQPAHQTDPKEIQAFVASRWHGGILVSTDGSQIELRTAGLLSGEPFFVRAYLDNLDLHTRAAVRMWGLGPLLSRYPHLEGTILERWKNDEAFNNRERQVGKRVNFAHLFRSGADTMQTSVHGDIGELLPLEFFAKIAAARSSELPVLWEWQESMIREARRTGRITLPLTGQMRLFMGGDKYDVNEIVNFPVQATAANAALCVQAHVHSLLRRHRDRTILPYLNVYDAIKFDCRDASSVRRLRSMIDDAVAFVSSPSGYWGQLSQLTGHVVPLKFDTKELAR